MNANHTISDVSRIAGIPKDLLRMWERRYGYPKPARDGNGDRLYSDRQLEKLVVIRQLVDQGKRPGKLMPLDLVQLEALLDRPKGEFEPARLIELLRAGDAAALRAWFADRVRTLGVRAFVHEVLVPANRAVGGAWSKGELAIHEEHLYTESVKGILRESLSGRELAGGRPRVMLTTLPGEKHSLGLLMAETLIGLGGAEAISFGTEMPFRDIADAASMHNVDVIAFSFSASFKADDGIAMISGLRQMIDPGIEFWVGGAAFGADAAFPPGVTRLEDLLELERTLAKWRPSEQTG